MANNNPVSLNSRTYSQIQQDLISFIQQYYPEIQDFSTSSIGRLLLDLNAGVGDNLNGNLDRNFTETQLKYAQLKSSIMGIGENLGLNTNIIAKRPSVTIVDFSVTVPVKGDRPDTSYYPVLMPGSQVIGGGKTFETQTIIDWNSDISSLGNVNRTIIPNIDSNGIVQSYNVTKREVVINGSTNIFKKIITETESTPFFQITLPDSDVINIDSIILLDGTNYSTNPTLSDFNNPDYKYYEVESLADQKVFIDNPSTGTTTGIQAAKWIDVTKKFIKEYTPNGFCMITFGSGDIETDIFKNGFIKYGITNQEFLNNYLKNTALGVILKKNSTLFIKYRTGGGSNSNIGANTLNKLGNYQLSVNGQRQDFNIQVQRSLSVNNPIAAIGGSDGVTTEQLRYLIKYNLSSQNRDVVLTDYLLQVYKMPGKYGTPFRVNALKKDNKIVIPILSLNSDGTLSNISNSLLKQNISEYLSNFKMINDYIQVTNGQIFNLAFDIDVYAENGNDSEIANNIITTVKNYFDINNQQMNTDINISDLQKSITELPGVINVINIKVYNKFSGDYSMNIIPQEFVNNTTGEIKLINNMVYSSLNSMFEIKYPNRDIKVFLRKKAV